MTAGPDKEMLPWPAQSQQARYAVSLHPAKIRVWRPLGGRPHCINLHPLASLPKNLRNSVACPKCGLRVQRDSDATSCPEAWASTALITAIRPPCPLEVQCPSCNTVFRCAALASSSAGISGLLHGAPGSAPLDVFSDRLGRRHWGEPSLCAGKGVRHVAVPESTECGGKLHLDQITRRVLP